MSRYSCTHWTRSCVQHCSRVCGSSWMCHQSTQCNPRTQVWCCPTQVYPIKCAIKFHPQLHHWCKIAWKWHHHKLHSLTNSQNNSYMETLSCFMYKMNYKRHCLGPILKDTLSKCDDHLQNTHCLLNPKP